MKFCFDFDGYEVSVLERVVAAQVRSTYVRCQNGKFIKDRNPDLYSDMIDSLRFEFNLLRKICNDDSLYRLYCQRMILKLD